MNSSFRIFTQKAVRPIVPPATRVLPRARNFPIRLNRRRVKYHEDLVQRTETRGLSPLSKPRLYGVGRFQECSVSMRFVTLLFCALAGNISAQVVPWSSLGGNPEHTALAEAQAQALGRIRWHTPVDLAPQYDDEGELLIHYGSPLVTARDTVIVPVKTGATGGLRIEARGAGNGTLKWSATSDYVFPPANWTPEFAPAMTPNARARLYYPGAGGTVYFRDDPDSNRGSSGQIAFYGLSNYMANRQAYNSTVMINTPLTVDSGGNVYFGFLVTGQNPSDLASGIARISASGQGTWVSAAA